ncbi:MAG: hypothetical protein Q8918_14350 [Bacteroidota bacterium]|nr:hypothetical protein [Bacteroidota bacterium]MDP4251283.1 hypothetical protein [Bacteroidota bacterium]
MSRSFAAFCLASVIILSSCHKTCHEQNYIFTSNDVFYPEKDSIQVGDTLQLTCTISKSQRLVYFSGAENLGGNLVISNIDSFATRARGAVEQFAYFNVLGSLYSNNNLLPNNIKLITYKESDSAYNLNVGIIALKKGRYIFSFTDDPGVYRTGSANCGVANFLFVNVNKNKHLYLFENVNGSLGPDDNLHSYCFKVY